MTLIHYRDQRPRASEQSKHTSTKSRPSISDSIESFANSGGTFLVNNAEEPLRKISRSRGRIKQKVFLSPLRGHDISLPQTQRNPNLTSMKHHSIPICTESCFDSSNIQANIRIATLLAPSTEFAGAIAPNNQRLVGVF